MAQRLPLVVAAVALLAIPTLAAPTGPTYATTLSLDDITPSLAGPLGETTVSNGAEPSILVDRLGRAILIGDQLGVLRSTNGGASWSRLSIPFIAGHDPVFGIGIYDGWALAQDDAGTIYASTTDGAVINLASSQDGGATWDVLPATLFADGGGIADRPWLAARGDGQVAISWNMGGAGLQRCDYTADGGLTFLQRSSPAPGLSGNGVPIGGLPAFMANGNFVYAGNGFGTAATLYRYGNPPCTNSIFTLPLPSHGAQMSTQVATEGNRIYVATPTPSNNGVQLLGFNGFTAVGSKSLVVSPSTHKASTFTTVAARPGEVAVGWYATTTAGSFTTPGFTGEWNVYVARVKDYWTTSPQVRVDQVTTVPNHVGDFCFQGTNCDIASQTGGTGDRDLLDYWQLTYDAAGNVHLAYGHDGSTSSPEVRYAQLPVWT